MTVPGEGDDEDRDIRDFDPEDGLDPEHLQRKIDDFEIDGDPTRPREIPVPPGYFESLQPDQLNYHNEWMDKLDDLPPDLSRSKTFGRGCVVAWHCRVFPKPNTLAGCERDCLWTRDTSQLRPNCYGYHRGRGVLEPGDLLYPVVQELCQRCLNQRFCAVDTEARWGSA